MKNWERRDRKKNRNTSGGNKNARIMLGTNRFHIYAKYRFPHLKTHPDNITIVNVQKHGDYHELFGLRTPEEVLYYLNEYFWGNLFILKIEKGGENEQD